MLSLFRGGYAIRDQEATYFLTATVIDWLELFLRPELAYVVTKSLTYCSENKRLQIHAWCLMPNHLHLLCTQPDGHLSDVIRDFKRHTANQIFELLEGELIAESRRQLLLNRLTFAGSKIGQKFKIWQEGNHPIVCLNREIFEQKVNYIHENPVRAGLVWEPEQYRYSSARYYFDGVGLVPIVE